MAAFWPPGPPVKPKKKRAPLPKRDCELCWGEGRIGFVKLSDGLWYHGKCIKGEEKEMCFYCGEWDLYEFTAEAGDDGNLYHPECLEEFDLHECDLCGAFGVGKKSWKAQGFPLEALMVKDSANGWLCLKCFQDD